MERLQRHHPWRSLKGKSQNAEFLQIINKASQSGCRIENGQLSFYGYLDTTTLGGAGFASQKTAKPDLNWDFSRYDGLSLTIAEADCKLFRASYHSSPDLVSILAKFYTIVLKDELTQPDPTTGREQATISWEYDFAIGVPSDAYGSEGLQIRALWCDFKPTYRGKPVKNGATLDIRNVKQMSLMMRRYFAGYSRAVDYWKLMQSSFFGTQNDSFCITFKSIDAFQASESNPCLAGVEHSSPYQYRDNPVLAAVSSPLINEKAGDEDRETSTAGRSWFCCC